MFQYPVKSEARGTAGAQWDAASYGSYAQTYRRKLYTTGRICQSHDIQFKKGSTVSKKKREIICNAAALHTYEIYRDDLRER